MHTSLDLAPLHDKANDIIRLVDQEILDELLEDRVDLRLQISLVFG